MLLVWAQCCSQTQLVEIATFIGEKQLPLVFSGTKEVIERDWVISGAPRAIARPTMTGALQIGHTMFISQLLRVGDNTFTVGT
jgi:hypothetical protein